MHRILCPVDGSEASLRAVEHVINMAQEMGPLEVRLLNVQEPPIVYGEVEVYASAKRAEELRILANRRHLAAAGEKLQRAGVQFEAEGVEGNPARLIAQRAQEAHCDAIVMGTHGMGALGNLVLGSVATKVVHLTKLPVTLVH